MSVILLPPPMNAQTTIISSDNRNFGALLSQAKACAVPTAMRDAMSATFTRFPEADWAGVELEFGADGSPGMLWRNDRAYAYIDVLLTGRIHYYYEPEVGEPSEDVVGSAHDLPDALGEAIAAAGSQRYTSPSSFAAIVFYPPSAASPRVSLC